MDRPILRARLSVAWPVWAGGYPTVDQALSAVPDLGNVLTVEMVPRFAEVFGSEPLVFDVSVSGGGYRSIPGLWSRGHPPNSIDVFLAVGEMGDPTHAHADIQKAQVDHLLQDIEGVLSSFCRTHMPGAPDGANLYDIESNWEPGPEMRSARSVAEDVRPLAAGPPVPNADESAPTVFLSYNHGDAEAALRLRAALRQRGLVVHVDSEAMEAGEDIHAFVERSVHATDATVCVISNRSLRSPWVASETIQAFYARTGPRARRFIAAYLDDDFFHPHFRLDATEGIDARIAEIDGLFPRYAEKHLDIDDLNAERSRLIALRNNLGGILAHLKGSLTLDLRHDAFDNAVARIVETLTA